MAEVGRAPFRGRHQRPSPTDPSRVAAPERLVTRWQPPLQQPCLWPTQAASESRSSRTPPVAGSTITSSDGNGPLRRPWCWVHPRPRIGRISTRRWPPMRRRRTSSTRWMRLSSRESEVGNLLGPGLDYVEIVSPGTGGQVLPAGVTAYGHDHARLESGRRLDRSRQDGTG